jgi:hypothetical protein
MFPDYVYKKKIFLFFILRKNFRGMTFFALFETSISVYLNVNRVGPKEFFKFLVLLFNRGNTRSVVFDGRESLPNLHFQDS